VLLIVGQPGLAPVSLELNAAAHDSIVVLGDEPAPIADAYAFIKCMYLQHGQARFHVVANMVDDGHHGQELFMKLTAITDRFLTVSRSFLGAVPADLMLHDAMRAQRSVCQMHPQSKSARAFSALASTASRWPVPVIASGRLEFFVERLLGHDNLVPSEVSA
jgi:flagellar biosynthesis protein FlhG